MAGDAAIDEEAFRKALGLFAGGVTVITANSAEGVPFGFTATAFSSLSLHPPLVLFCMARDSSGFDIFRQAPGFAINILARDQAELSGGFAAKGSDKFAGVAHRPGRYGAPLLEGCVAHLECRTREQIPGGDHVIYVGEVEASVANGGEPLLYFNGGYHTLEPILPGG